MELGGEARGLGVDMAGEWQRHAGGWERIYTEEML
jgi:hypothetical protein